jgi:hypothetical protein
VDHHPNLIEARRLGLEKKITMESTMPEQNSQLFKSSTIPKNSQMGSNSMKLQNMKLTGSQQIS